LGLGRLDDQVPEDEFRDLVDLLPASSLFVDLVDQGAPIDPEPLLGDISGYPCLVMWLIGNAFCPMIFMHE
jgi:hypothetical protein